MYAQKLPKLDVPHVRNRRHLAWPLPSPVVRTHYLDDHLKESLSHIEQECLKIWIEGKIAIQQDLSEDFECS